MKIPIQFMVIDDDPVNNLLCSMVIEEFGNEADVQAFEDAKEGLEYIKKQYFGKKKFTILFLDINMPTWSGWQFLDNFKVLDEEIKNQFKIYMLSSSVDPADKQRAAENCDVAGYIEKPLSEKTLLSILENQEEIA